MSGPVHETRETRTRTPIELKALLEAERAGIPFIYWRNADGEQRILALDPGLQRVTIGRRELAEVSLPWDTEVSRTHALLEPLGDEWTIVDDGLSRNGSFVNGNRVIGRRRLHDRDQMCVGNTHVVFRAPHLSEAPSTARTPGSTTTVQLTDMQRKILIALCRPVSSENAATPATNPQIGAEVHLSVDAVKAHLRLLFDRFGVGELQQNEKRTRLVSIVLAGGVLTPRDF